MINEKITILFTYLPIIIGFSVFSTPKKSTRKPKSQTSLKIMLDKRLGTRESYTCKTCKKNYANSTTLRSHIQSKHEGKVYTCQYCDKTFTTRQGLWQHKKTVHEKKQYPCKQCKKNYNSKSSLWTHIRTVHEKIRYTCDACGTKHTQLTHLKNHKKTRKHFAVVATQRIAKDNKKKIGEQVSVLELENIDSGNDTTIPNFLEEQYPTSI